MKEIKIRAFNKKTGGMIYSDETEEKRFEDKMTLFFSSMVMGLDIAGAELIYMLFTGLLDKNGKEIWEGDIIKDGHGSYGEIIWYQEDMAFKIGLKRGWQHPLYDGFEKETIEIIGNIYENEDLLNNAN